MRFPRAMMLVWFLFAIALCIFAIFSGTSQTTWIVGALIVCAVWGAADYTVTEIKYYIARNELRRATRGY